MYHSSIRRRALGFLVLQFWLSLDWFSGFCFQKLWFFYFLHFGLWILCSLAFDFLFSSKVQMGFWNFLWSEQQLTTSTDLEQLQNTIVIDRTAWQTKCHWNNFLLVKYDYKGFLSKKKKKPQCGLHSIMSHILYFGLSYKISNFNECDPIHDPVCGPVRDPIWSNPGFVNTVKWWDT